MKVLFLDVDGVLNSERFWRREQRPDWYVIDPAAVARVLGLLRRTDSKAVLSSTWRLDSVGCQRLTDAGLSWIDATPALHANSARSSGGRGAEIRAWLDANPVARFAIVDDDPDAGVGTGLGRCFVRTTWEQGILDKHVRRLEALLA